MYSIEQFVQGVFGNSVLQFTCRDLVMPKLGNAPSWNLGWKQIPDLYRTAEQHFRLGNTRGRKAAERTIRLELQLLVELERPTVRDHGALTINPTADGTRRARKAYRRQWSKLRANASMTDPRGAQYTRHHYFISWFWRICHKLLRMDLAWSGYQYSFVLDFVLELEKLARIHYGKEHPLHMLLYALASIQKADLQHILSLGVSRTLQAMAPAAKGLNVALVFLFWTDYLYKDS